METARRFVLQDHACLKGYEARVREVVRHAADHLQHHWLLKFAKARMAVLANSYSSCFVGCHPIDHAQGLLFTAR